MQSASSFHKLVYSRVTTMKILKEDTQIRRVCVYDMDKPYGRLLLISQKECVSLDWPCRNLTYKEKSLIVPMYKAIVRPHLEYCIQAWSPYLRKDIDMLEKIQRRATKLIPGLRDLRYEERLKECGLTTLEKRRVRGDQIEVFKILNGYENIDSNIFFEIKESKITRGHNFTLVKKQSRLDVRKFSFSQRTINVWNKLSSECVHASSVNMFKNRIDKYLVKAGYT